MELWKHAPATIAVIVIWTFTDQGIDCYSKNWNHWNRKFIKGHQQCYSGSRNKNSVKEQGCSTTTQFLRVLKKDDANKRKQLKKLEQHEHCQEQRSHEQEECMTKLKIHCKEILGVRNSVRIMRNDNAKLSNSVVALQTDMKTMKTEMTSAQTKLNSSINCIEERQSQISFEVERRKTEISETTNRHNLQIENLTKYFESTNGNLNILKKEQNELHNEFQKKTETVRELEFKLQESNTKLTILEDEQKNLRHELQERTETISDLEVQLQSSVEENEKLSNTVSTLSKKFEKIENDMRYYKDKVPSIDSLTRQMEVDLKSVVPNTLVVSLLLTVILTVCGCYYVKNSMADLTLKNESNQNDCSERSVARRPNESSSLMDKIRPQTLQQSLGVVSFDQTRSHSHKQLMEGVLKSGNIGIEVVQTTISDEEMVLGVSPSKVVFIFVDANNRNIILEDPDQEMGGFRATTTEALIKMGCEVFVIYSKDVESNVLESTDFFHKRLRSIQRHRLLSSLKQRSRVMSINDTFHDHQIQFLHKELRKFFC